MYDVSMSFFTSTLHRYFDNSVYRKSATSRIYKAYSVKNDTRCMKLAVEWYIVLVLVTG